MMEKRKFRIITLLADIVILTISFVAIIWTKPASLKDHICHRILHFFQVWL